MTRQARFQFWLVLLTALAFALSAAGDASADFSKVPTWFRPAMTAKQQRDEVRAFQIANQAWAPLGGVMCAASVSYDDLRRTTRYGFDGTKDYLGLAFVDQCHVVLDLALVGDFPRWCSVIVHEWGHLVLGEHVAAFGGGAHSPDPSNVMYPVLSRTWPGCRRQEVLKPLARKSRVRYSAKIIKSS